VKGNAFSSRGLGLELSQHSGGGLHIGGEVKPQLQALRGGTIQDAQKAVDEAAVGLAFSWIARVGSELTSTAQHGKSEERIIGVVREM
jgi:hypothetical protein